MSIIGDIKEEGMQQLPSAMEYDSGGATYQQHAAYGQQWQPQQHHPMQMMQARAPIYSAPAAAYPVVEPVDLSGVDPTDNASPVAVLDVVREQITHAAIASGQWLARAQLSCLLASVGCVQSSAVNDALRVESAVPALQDLHLKIVSAHAARDKEQRGREKRF